MPVRVNLSTSTRTRARIADDSDAGSDDESDLSLDEFASEALPSRVIQTVDLKRIIATFLKMPGVLEDIQKNLKPNDTAPIAKFSDGLIWRDFLRKREQEGYNVDEFVPFMLFYDDFKVGFSWWLRWQQ